MAFNMVISSLAVHRYSSRYSNIPAQNNFEIFLDKVYGILQMFTFLSIPLLMLYNGERGKAKGMKWLFYIYYPAHLVAVGALRLMLHGNIPTIFQ